MRAKKQKDIVKIPAPANSRGRPRIAPDLRTERGRIGQRIRALREKLGLSVREVATRAGITGEQLYALERGEVPAWFRRLADLLNALDCEIGDLIPEAD
jgi:DNA-binding Xre family transcriptional regulator